ncbi:MAG: tetratricopeptide repeat protein, partial [Pseudomonadota bacterium]
MATRPAWAQNDTACADLFQTGADDPSQLGALQADCFRGLLTQSAAVQAETAARFIRQDLPYVPLDLEAADFAALAPAAERLLRAHYSRQQTRLDIAGLSERLNRQIAAAEAVGDELSLVYLHRSAGAEAFKRTDTEAMKRHFSEGLRLARKNGLRHMVPELVHSLALTAKLGGDYSRAIDLYRESLTLLEERNEFAKVGVIYASIAVLFSEIGDHDTAIDLNMKAMDYYRDYMDENPRQMATAMMNSGTAHHRAGRHEQAIEAYEKAAEYQKAVASDWLNGILNFNWA